MAVEYLFPYEVLDDEVVLEVYAASVDGQSGGGVDLGRERVVGLTDLGYWDEVALSVRVRVDADRLAAIASDPRVVVSVQCKRTNVRQAVVLERDPGRPGSHTGELVLERELLAGQAELQAVVAGVVDGVADRFLGRSALTRVHLEAPRIPDISGDLEVKWRDFTDGQEPLLEPELHDQASHLELDREQGPVLWLNSHVQGLRRLLDDHGDGSPAARAMRDVVFDAIAAPALLAMFHTAVDTAREIADGDEAVLPDGWRGDVLATLLRRIQPAQPVEQTLQDIVSEPDPTLHARAHEAVAGFLSTTRHAVRAIETLETEEDPS